MIGAAGYMANLRKKIYTEGEGDAGYLSSKSFGLVEFSSCYEGGVSSVQSMLRASTVVSKFAVDQVTVLSFGCAPIAIVIRGFQ